MANSTIAAQELVLISNWPGYALPEVQPQDFFNLATHTLPVGGSDGQTVTITQYFQNVATPAYPLGTKIQLPIAENTTTGAGAYMELVYVRFAHTAPTLTAAACQICVPASATAANTTLPCPWVVTTDSDDDLVSGGGGLAGILLSAMTIDYYGFIWTGGMAHPSMTSDGSTAIFGTNTVATYNGAVTAGVNLCVRNGETAKEFVVAAYAGTETTIVMGLALAADD